MLSFKYKAKIFFFLFLFSWISQVSANQEINNMIFFGDSLSDIGNNTWILMNGEVGTPITNPNSQNRKYLWVNYLVEAQLQKLVYPSSQPGLIAFNDNISYAYASADTSNHYLNADWPQQKPPEPVINEDCHEPGLIKNVAGDVLSVCVPGLLLQMDAYLYDVQQKPNPKSLFFIWAGANDLLNYYTAYMNHTIFKKIFFEWFSLPSKEELSKVEQHAINNIMLAKKKLIDAGVNPEMIYILDLPDLSRTPAVRSNHSWELNTFYGKTNLEKSLSVMSNDFNKNLRSQIEERKYRIPLSHYVRIQNLLDDAILHPDKYQLTNIDESCIANKAMPACTGYLFYNARHPTTFANKIIAESIISVLNL